jgi:hypothetical protein
MAISKDFVVKNGLQVGSSLQVNSTATFSNDVTISGNLTVSGTTTYVNTATLNIADNIVTLNADVSGATGPTENAGLEVNRGSSANVQLRWNETTDSWEQSNAGLSVYYKLLANNDILDSLVSTSITVAASANSVKAAYDTAISQGSTAYSNATTYASNATNISSGTLNTARLPAQVNVSANLNIGAFGTTNGVNIQNTAIIVGNSTANATHSYNLLQASNATSTANLSPVDLKIGSAIVNSTVLTITTVNATTVNANTSGIHTGNVSATVVNASANVNAPLVFANVTGTYANITGQVNTATFFAATSANVGGNVQITVSQYGITGNVTTAPTMSLTGSALTIGNSSITGAPSINLANSTGNTTVNVTSIGSSWGLISNASGVYHSGVVNAASHTTTTTVSNTTGFFPTTNAIALGNSIGLWVISANSLGANSITVTGGNLNAATVYATGLVNAANFVTTGTVNTATVFATGLVNAANFTTTGTVNTATVFATGLVNAANFTTTGTVNTATVFATGRVNAANFTTTGTVNTATVFATGQINAASHTTTNSVSNTSGFFPISNAAVGALGNSTGLWVVLANSVTTNTLTVSGGTITSGNVNITGYVNASANLVAPLVFANVSAGYANVTGQVNTVTFFATTSANVGGNVQITVSQYGITGNTTTAPTMSLTGSALTIGNNTITGAPSINLANSIGNTTVNAIAIGSSWGLISNASGIYHSGATAVINAFSHTSGSGFIANSTAIVGTGFANVTTSVNSASHTVGTNFIANATALVHTGFANVTTSVNSALLTVGTAFTANSTLVNAAAINVVNQVNTATLFASTSANVGANVQLTTSQFGITGNTTTAPTMSLTGSALTVGNSTVTGAPSIKLANSIGNTTVNAIAIGSSWGLSSNSTGLYHSNSLTIGNTSGDFTSVNSSVVKIVGGTGNLSIVAYDATLGGPSIYMKSSEGNTGGLVILPDAIYMVASAYTLASGKYGPYISAEVGYPGFTFFDPADGSERSFIGEDGIRYATAGGTNLFEVNGTNMFSYNTLLVGKTAADAGATSGVELLRSGTSYFTRSASTVMIINRLTSDSTLVSLQQDSTTEGSISVSGTTITYGTFAGAHWSQLSDNSRPNILRGTVVETIDEMCQWENEENDQLSKFKISDTVASKSVYGVFQTWDNDDDVNNDANIVSLGAYLIRIDAGVTVAKSDLLESAGNGCARVQSDDIVRSSTIGKVTNGTHIIETYEDGSYLVPCVLYCG